MIKDLIHSIKFNYLVFRSYFNAFIDRFFVHGGRKAALSEQGERYISYLIKVMEDEDYTYESYSEMKFYKDFEQYRKDADAEDLSRQLAAAILSISFIPYM